MQAVAGGPLHQRRMPVPGGAGLLIQLMQMPPVPKAALDAERGPVHVNCDGIGGIGLQLDRIGPGACRGIDQSQRPVQIAIMVARQFGNHIGAVIRARWAARRWKIQTASTRPLAILSSPALRLHRICPK